MQIPKSEERQFEDDVRHIARLLWPSAKYSGATLADSRERDGIFETEEMIHVVECTRSRRKDKADQDIKKTIQLIQKLRRSHSDKGTKGWFITFHEPTADQRAVADKYKGSIVTCSFDQFRSKLVDARIYLSLRGNLRFGSVRNLSDDTSNVAMNEFVDMDFLEYQTDRMWRITAVATAIKADRRSFVFIGDFGAGKSMALRELFILLRKDFYKGLTSRFPVYLNLRDHYGQTDPVEALERHARQVGYERTSQLVRAWRADQIALILDGFDEIASAGWYGITKKLKQLRYEAMTLVRNFVVDNPANAPLVLAGRSHYFDSMPELANALGTSGHYIYLTLSEFTEEQVQTYLRRKGLDTAVPDWLPTRPLLVGYLAAKGLLSEVIGSDDTSQANAWYRLWKMVCEREALIEANIDADTVQELMERLATRARAREGGLGPILADEISDEFRDIVGHPPDDKAQMLLLRLPGLSAAAADDSSRSFIDEDLAETARAGDVVRFCVDPFNYNISEMEKAQITLGYMGASVGAVICAQKSLTRGKVITALRKTDSDDELAILGSDILKIIICSGWSVDGNKITIQGALVDHFMITRNTPNLSGVIFCECLFERLEIEHGIEPDRAPKFRACMFGMVEGPVGREDLPKGLFDRLCEFDEFSRLVPTTSALLDLQLPMGVKVLLTILKKLFVQPGKGRQESALYRGLDHRARRLVPDVLQTLESEGLAKPAKLAENVVWLPSRSNGRRAREILTAPSVSRDPLLKRCAEID